MVAAALRVVRAKGISCLTAKAMADELGTSTRPIFTGFGSMDDVKQEVYAAAVRVYDSYTSTGLKEKSHFLVLERAISDLRMKNLSFTGSCF